MSNTQDTGPLVANFEQVQRLQSAVLNAPRDVNMLRMALGNTLRLGAWLDRLDPRQGKRFQFSAEQFLEFIKRPVPDGLQTDVETIRRFIADEPEVAVLFEQAITRTSGGPNNPHGCVGKPREEKNNLDNIKVDSVPTYPTGTSSAAAIRRLAKDRPDLLEEVKAGKVSPHRAMVQAGFRKVPTPYEVMCRAWLKATKEERDRFMSEKNEEGW